MPTVSHINYLSLCKDKIAEPILIVGSKEYDFDQENFLGRLHSWGFSNVTGIDLSFGEDTVTDRPPGNLRDTSRRGFWLETAFHLPQTSYGALPGPDDLQT